MAIRDILPGEQITDEYGMFNLEKEIHLSCGFKNCRKVVKPEDFETYYQEWDGKIQASMARLFQVAQPLLPLVDASTREELDAFFVEPHAYKSVYSLKYNKEMSQGT